MEFRRDPQRSTRVPYSAEPPPRWLSPTSPSEEPAAHLQDRADGDQHARQPGRVCPTGTGKCLAACHLTYAIADQHGEQQMLLVS